jgi:hypothetical protein
LGGSRKVLLLSQGSVFMSVSNENKIAPPDKTPSGNWMVSFWKSAISCVWPIRSGYDVLRIIMAIVLLVAATLKTYELATRPVLGNSLLDSRWLLMAVVEFEFFFGLWLLAGHNPKPTWAAVLALFCLFTSISLYKALAGYASCGCFGPISVNPWYTATLDTAIVISLLFWRPNSQESLFAINFKRLPVQFAKVLAVWPILAIPAGYVMGSYTDTTLSEAGEIIGDGKIVVLEPEKWIGKRFPLLNYIDIGDKLANGLWLVLLHKHSCSVCRDAAVQYELLARDFSKKSNCPSIALIDCPPYAKKAGAANDSLLVGGRLHDTEEWLFSRPFSVLLDKGTVRSVYTNARDVEYLKSIWGSDGS